MNNLAAALRADGALDEAAQLADAAHAGKKELLGPAHPETLELAERRRHLL